MAWYPGATKMELQPESDAQAAIRPTQMIVHSIAAPWTPRRTFEYWRDSTNLESHFGLGYDGSLAQYIGTETKADANASANRRPDGTGAVSIETASKTDSSDPWTDAQVEALISLGVWMHRHHGVPLRICRTASDPGFGYHRLHPEWSLGGTACPGPARVTQFREVVFPGIVARATGTDKGEDDMPTAAEIAKAVWGADIIDVPWGTEQNPQWAAKTIVTSTGEILREVRGRVKGLEAQLAAQGETIRTLATALANQDPAVDVDVLVRRVEQAIEQVTVRLDVPDTENGS